MLLDAYTLLAANAIILSVMALAFFAAWRGHRNQHYWPSWMWANVALSAALFSYMFETYLPGPIVAILGNTLLVVGFSLRWRAARQFAGRSVPALAQWGPPVLFAGLALVPWLRADMTSVFILVNVFLSLQTAAITWEFWRDRGDRLWSRYGLVAAYGIMVFSFGARAGQGVLFFDTIARALPMDGVLMAHLILALFHTAAGGAFALSIAYERHAAALRRAALHDPLTGLENRRAFEARLRSHLDSGDRRAFAVVVFDVDHFKRINDRYGHAAGDAALRACAARCRRGLRAGDFIARIGGEEFAAILPGASAREAYRIVERVRLEVAEREMLCAGHRIRVTISAGICHSADGAGDFDQLMRAADKCLYRAKRTGRDRVSQIAA